jgi:hypothetical protein
MTAQTMASEKKDRTRDAYAGVVENERTAVGQKISRQPDGVGKRVGVKGEITFIGKLAPNGARTFRERLPQIQAEAAYYETRVGTVQDFRAMLIDNDTRLMVTIVYDGDFKQYVEDVLRDAAPWLDQVFFGVWDGFKGTKDRESVERDILAAAIEAEVFFNRNPDVTVRDVAKMQRVSKAVSELLDAAS